MKTIEEILSGMEVREAYEFGRMAERLEMAREADARWEKNHAEVVDGLDRVIGMLGELPGKVLKAAVAAAEEAERKAEELMGEREWVDEEEVAEDERVIIALPWDVVSTLMGARAVADEAAN